MKPQTPEAPHQISSRAPFFLPVCFRPSQRRTRKGWSPGSSRSSNCSACSPGKQCWTCLFIARKGRTAPPHFLVITGSVPQGAALPRVIALTVFLCFCLMHQLDLRVQLPPHSGFCERRRSAAGSKAVPHDPPRSPGRAHRSRESQRNRRSVSAPHAHQSCDGGTGKTSECLEDFHWN